MPQKPITKVIGERIRVLRKHQELSQEELAHLAELHPTYIGQLERGEKNPTIHTIHKITMALEVPISQLFHLAEAVNDEQINTLLLVNDLNEEDRQAIIKIIEVMLNWKNHNK
ncbi:helix-turn-helix domain-containing protein [Virgibacillus senegalensis]|uniref:helix-turn-helix domain-containing protein n=1 Tax=Virgibacillus senegalensis TaxID=1499679 RepID=UPI00069F86C6|nr:helix-turn-helix transcriptional regulator [Virgibacillus senegalensis]